MEPCNKTPYEDNAAIFSIPRNRRKEEIQSRHKEPAPVPSRYNITADTIRAQTRVRNIPHHYATPLLVISLFFSYLPFFRPLCISLIKSKLAYNKAVPRRPVSDRADREIYRASDNAGPCKALNGSEVVLAPSSDFKITANGGVLLLFQR